MVVSRKGVESGIERSSDLGKCEAVDAALIGHKGVRRLQPLQLVRLGLKRAFVARPVRQAMENTQLLGKHQQKRQ